MRHSWSKFVASLLMVSTLLSLVPWQLVPAHAQSSDELQTGELFEDEFTSPEMEGDLIDNPADDPQRENLLNQGVQNTDALMVEFKQQFLSDISAGMGTAAYNDTYYPTNKIVLNATDKLDIDQYYVLQSALPDLRTDLIEFARLTGKSVEELMTLSTTDAKQYQALIDATTKTKFTDAYIKSRILGDMNLLSNLLNLASASQAISELQNNRESVIAAIDNAIAYKLDSKIIQTLNYLVRPKNDPRGGAGHWRIRVARLKKNYSRDNTKYSRESNEVIAANNRAENPVTSTAASTGSSTSTSTSSTSATEQSTIGELAGHTPTELENDAAALGVNSVNTIAAGEIQDANGTTVSDFLVNTDEIQTNVSSHYKGQAVDIDQVDSIKCTKIERKRIGSAKKTALQPYNIKLAWQTSEGFASDNQDITNSFNSLMWSQGQGSLMSMLSELNIDFNNINNLNSANFSDLATVVGQAFFAQALNSPEGDIWNFPLSETLRKLGGVLIADKLSLDRGPFLDTSIQSIDTLTESIGRAAIEKKLRLPYGTLKGGSRDQMLINAGKYRVLTELRLPTDVLETAPSSDEDLLQRIGSRIVETGLGLNKGSFYNKSSISQVSDAVGKYKFEAIMAFPADLDNEFNLTANTGRDFKAGSVSPADFNRRVATAALLATSYHYSDYSSRGTVVSGPDNPTSSNHRDEMFNLPEGTIDAFISNTTTDAQYKAVGIFALSRTFENDDLGRENLAIWLNSPTPDFKITGKLEDQAHPGQTIAGEVVLPKQSYATTLGVSSNEVYLILGNPADNATAGAFKRLGQKILFEAIRKSSTLQSAQNRFLADHPELQEGIAQYEFYRTRVDNIHSHLSILRDKANALKSALQGIEDQYYSLQDKQATNAMLDQLTGIAAIDPGNNVQAILSMAQQVIEHGDSATARVTLLNEMIDTHVNHPFNDLRSKVNFFNDELEYLLKNAYEMISGKEQNAFNLNDMRIGEMGFNRIDLGGTSVSVIDLVLLLTRKINPEDFFISIASAKIADELNLPPRALQYAAKMVKAAVEKKGNSKTAFFRAIGLAALEIKMNRNSSNQIANFSENTAEVGEASTVQELRDKLARSFNGDTEKANTVIASGLGLPGYNLDPLIRGDFGAWASAKPKAEANDKEVGLPIGTTENFIRGSSLSDAIQIGISDDDYRQFSTKLGISEATLRLFVAKANGEENPAVNTIYYVDQNRYMATNDTPDACGGKPVPDNVFMYYDQDGMHNFNSYPEANEYVRAHEDRKFGNFTDEISTRLWTLLTDESQTPLGTRLSSLIRDPGNLKTMLNDFISGKKNAVFTDTETFTFVQAALLDAYNIPEDLSGKFLARTSIEGIIPENGKIDFLKTVGVAMLKSFATAYLGQTLGLSIGSTRITADDIYEIFSGNSRQVFYRVGGAALDQELGLERGTFESILSAPNADTRRCAMSRAASQLLGDYLGIPGLRLEGSLFDNLGGGKLENLLGFPEGSFKGANIAAMIDPDTRRYVPIVAFFKGFSLPVPKTVSDIADESLQLMGKEYADRYKSRPFYEKAQAINNYLEALGNSAADLNPQLASNGSQVDTSLRQILPFILKNDFINEADIDMQVAYLTSNPTFSQYSNDDLAKLVRSFDMRLTSIDSAMEMDKGSTAKLLLDQISPDNFRRAGSRIVIEDMSVELLKKVFNIDTEVDAGDLRAFKDAILGGDPNQSGNERLGTIYSFMTKAFGWRFDEKAGFTRGTIAALIANPSMAPELLIQAGARLLDAQLGIEGKQASFSRFADIYVSDPTKDDVAYCNSTDIRATQSLDHCLRNRRLKAVGSAALEELEGHVAEEISDALRVASGVDVEVTVNNPLGGSPRTSIEHQHGITIDIQYIYDVFRGDFRILGVIATIRGIGAVLGDENGRYALGADSEDFLFNPQDVVDAYYGDPTTALYAAQMARDQVYAQNNAENRGLYESFQQNDEYTWNIPWGAANSGVTNITATPNAQAASTTYADLNYAVPQGAVVTPPTLTRPEPEPMPESYLYPPDRSVTTEQGWADYNTAYNAWAIRNNAWKMENDNNVRIINEANDAAADAVTRDRKLKKEYLEYRVSDCMLRKLDNHIPAGFTWAMMKGNGFVRTSALLNYVENWIRQDTSWGQYMPEGSLIAIYQFFDGPAGIRGNLDELINRTTAGVFDIIDDYLVEHSPKVFGLSFEPGTAQALFAFAKTGHWDEAVMIGGKAFSLKIVYADWSTDFIGGKIGGWADKKLGLPAGTTYGVYKIYRAYEKALKAYRLAEAGSVSQLAAQQKMTDLKAELVIMIINILFAKQIAAAEQALGLVPGTGALAVAMLVNYLMGASFNPVGAILFVAINLFGVYKVSILCTADGNYPEKTPEIDAVTIDNPGLGIFNGMDEQTRQEGYIKAAEYKADRLAQDLYEMPTKTGNKDLVPLQVMVGRKETVAKAKPLVLDTACKKVGASSFMKNSKGEELAICSGTYVGIWVNSPINHHFGV